MSLILWCMKLYSVSFSLCVYVGVKAGVSNLFDRRAECTNFKLVVGRISNFTTNKTQ